MIENSFSPVFYMTVLKIFNANYDMVNPQKFITRIFEHSPGILNNELNTNFESYRVDIFNRPRSALGSANKL